MSEIKSITDQEILSYWDSIKEELLLNSVSHGKELLKVFLV